MGGTSIQWIHGGFLFAIWLLFSGKFDVFHMVMGVLAVLLVLWLDWKLGPANLGKGDLPIRVNPVRLFLYVPWLMVQMLLSSYQVAKIILNPSMPVNPVLVKFNSAQPHTVARVLLGNSITLTPGTLTLDIDGDRYLVHALSDDSLKGLLSGDMQRKVARVFFADGNEPVSEVETGQEQVRGELRG